MEKYAVNIIKKIKLIETRETKWIKKSQNGTAQVERNEVSLEDLEERSGRWGDTKQIIRRRRLEE